jgi:DNA polymerase-3 subunit delta
VAALTAKGLAAEWSKGTFKPAYYLFGEDNAAKSLALSAARKSSGADDLNITEFSGDNDAQAAELVATCQTPPMFAERRLILVRKLKFGAPARRLIAEYLRDPLKSTVLIMVSEDRKPEAKDALAAAVQSLGGVVLFKPLTEGEAVKRLMTEAQRSGFVLEEDAAELLFEEAGGEWGILRSEIEKVRLFVKDKKRAGVAEVRACLGYKSETNPFDLPRVLQRRDYKKALELLQALLAEGTDPFRLLYQITQTVTKQMKAKRLVKTGVAQDQIFRELRLQKYYDRDYLTIAGRVSESALIKSLRACLDAEISLKSKSWLKPKNELETLVLRICGRA